MPVNAAWHAKHPMPPRATMAQRIEWHREHAKQCACGPIPSTVLAAMRGGPRGSVEAARNPTLDGRAAERGVLGAGVGRGVRGAGR